MNKGITFTIIFEAFSANYGEGYGNISSLKQLSRGDGNLYTYISRQAIRYNIVEQLGWNITPIFAEGSGEKKVVQFAPTATISEYKEIDLFGYMKTTKNESAATRNAVVRLSNATSLEPFNTDIDFLTNIGLAKRNNLSNSIVQSEIHKSYYSYTVSIDLDRVGVEKDNNGKITEEIPNLEKASRVCDLLDTIKLLYRDIRGRRENLSPLFVVGGLYESKNSFFLDRLKVTNNILDIKPIRDVLKIDETVKENTSFGYIDSIFSNSNEIKDELKPLSVGEFFEKLKEKVRGYYA